MLSERHFFFIISLAPLWQLCKNCITLKKLRTYNFRSCLFETHVVVRLRYLLIQLCQLPIVHALLIPRIRIVSLYRMIRLYIIPVHISNCFILKALQLSFCDIYFFLPCQLIKVIICKALSRIIFSWLDIFSETSDIWNIEIFCNIDEQILANCGQIII